MQPQARSHGHAGLTERLEARLHVMELQQRTAEALAGRAEASGGGGGGDNSGQGAEGSEAGEAAAELREAPRELQELYNDYAARFQVLPSTFRMKGSSANAQVDQMSGSYLYRWTARAFT